MEKPELLPPDDPLVHDIVELLRDLLHALLAASAPAWLDLQLTLPQLRALFLIAHNQASSVGQISKYLAIGEPTASHLIDKLVQAGLVDRREDPADRRRAIVRLSPGGKELIERLLGWEDCLGGWLYKIPRQDLLPFQRGLKAILHEPHGQTTNPERPAGDANQEVLNDDLPL